MKKNIILLAAIALLSMLAIGTVAQAETSTSALSFTGGSLYPHYHDLDETIGWGFTANATINVTALGVYDYGNDGLGGSHEVGIWDSLGTLLASTTVGNTSTTDGSYKYAAITPVTLATAQSYNIGVFLPKLNVDYYMSDAVITTDPAITFTGARRSEGIFSNPTITSDAQGRIGPNFQFTTGSAVPEPATLLGFGIPMLMVGIGKLRGLRK